ncbi:MAG: LysM peptidoglycan-binding domain-containing protein [Chitinophagales bacterium]|nr:LysM peptidoglycan-binding domain-containing protein [Chitinophagales bacterium]
MSKLTPDQRKEVIARRLRGENLETIRKATGLSKHTIRTLTVDIPKPDSGWKRTRQSQLTVEHKKEILSLLATMRYKEIAAKLNVSQYSVAHFLRKARPTEGWSVRPKPFGKLSETQKAEIVSRRLDGETLDDIAKRYGVSSVAIHKIVKHLKLPRRRRRNFTPQQIEDIKTRRSEGQTFQAIADFYGVTAPCIHTIVKKILT